MPPPKEAQDLSIGNEARLRFSILFFTPTQEAVLQLRLDIFNLFEITLRSAGLT